MEQQGSSPFRLAACAEMLFRERPLLDRIQAIDALGFDVEIWRSWIDGDLDAMVATGARFSSMTGYVHGDLVGPDDGEELLRTAQHAVEAAKRLGCPRLNLHGAELDSNGLPVRPVHALTGRMWLTAARTLDKLAALGERNGVTFVLENLNAPVDHPGVPFGRAEETIALVEAVGRPGVRLMLDIYHAQIGEGNLVELIRRAGDLIGEIQVADVPGRHEPGTGEINYPAIAHALNKIGYRGTIGLEAWPSGDSELALQRFRAAFA